MRSLALIIFCSISLIACNTTDHLHNTGVYTIKERNGSETEFYEVKGKYEIVSDTLKVNDKIQVTVIKPKAYKKLGNTKNPVAKAY